MIPVFLCGLQLPLLHFPPVYESVEVINQKHNEADQHRNISQKQIMDNLRFVEKIKTPDIRQGF